MLASERREMRHGHAEALLPLVDAVVRRAGLAPAELGAVAVSTGPGGFTGIRVGLAAARGIALAAGARLIGVSSFAAVAALAPPCPGGLPLLVALDSRRSEIFVQLFAADGVALAEPAAVPPLEVGGHVAERVGSMALRIAGDAAVAAAAALTGRVDTEILGDCLPDARGVLAAAMRPGTADAAPVQPLYLRPPDVTPPPLAGPPEPALRVAALPPSAAAPLAQLHRACFPDEPWDAAAMARILSLPGSFGHVAWIGEKPVGFILARDLGGECEILSLGVVPVLRRHGIGARLLRAACEAARRLGAASVVLEVATDNRAARKLYAALDFDRVGHRPRYYRRPGGLTDALILRLGLSDMATSR